MEHIPINEVFPEDLPNWHEQVPASELKIVSWNVNSLNACVKKGFLRYIKAEAPDIICLQETKLNVFLPERFPFQLYPYQFHYPSLNKKGYSGSLILSKLKPVQYIYGFPKTDSMNDFQDEEGRIITLIFPHIHVVSVYIPCAREKFERLQFKLDFVQALHTHLSLLQKASPIICCGDLNIAHQEIDVSKPPSLHSKLPGLTPLERLAFTNLLHDQLVDVWRELHPDELRFTSFSYRHQSRKKRNGTRWDYFLASKQLMNNKYISDCQIRDTCYGASDHVPLTLTISRRFFVLV